MYALPRALPKVLIEETTSMQAYGVW
jgi:hypothetical protein